MLASAWRGRRCSCAGSSPSSSTARGPRLGCPAGRGGCCSRSSSPTATELSPATSSLEALWPDGRDSGLAPLLSKLRRIVPLDGLRITLPHDAWVDIEAASDAVHRAESALAQQAFHRAWGPAQVAMFVAGRPFLAGEEAPWIDEIRRPLAELHLRALEAYAHAGLGIGGTELAAAVRGGRRLTRIEPYRETGYRLLMEALAREGNTAEALRVYDELRTRLRADLGVAPSAQTQELHKQLLR